MRTKKKTKNMSDVFTAVVAGQTLYSARHVKQVLGLKGNLRHALAVMGLPYTRANFELKDGLRRLIAISGSTIVALAEKYSKEGLEALKAEIEMIEQCQKQ